MKPLRYPAVALAVALGGALFCLLNAATRLGSQPADDPFRGGPPPPPFDRPPGGPPGGRSGPPMGVEPDVALVGKFDRNGDRRLVAAERKEARSFLAQEKAAGRGPRRPGPPGRQRDQTPAPVSPGPRLTPADVKPAGDAAVYDPKVLRTLFLEFAEADWEKELAEFYHTDVDVAARLTVDGVVYPEVGVHFRGASSFFTVSEGRKRSLKISMNFADPKGRLGGCHALELLNSHTDPTFLRTVLSQQMARDYLPAPKANYVRLVVNAESWGIYVNAQPFNKDFIQDWFHATAGSRWKVPGSPRGDGGLRYLGEDLAAYRQRYDLKSKEDPTAWAALIHLCRVLAETPAVKLEQAVEPLLDVDGALKFLALQNALINSDGYWIRASDYNLYLDGRGKFHLIPHDSNETFGLPEAPGRELAEGVELEPMAGVEDASKPLLHQLLKVPGLRQRYLGYLRDIATRWLDWGRLGPLAVGYQALISADVAGDTHKLYPTEEFSLGVTGDTEERGFRGRQRRIGLKPFVDQRRAFLLRHPLIQALPADAARPEARGQAGNAPQP